MLTARQLYFEAVKVGDELPPLVKPPIDRVQVARYAGAALDWNPLSVDEQHARNAGFPGALVPAMVSMGFLGELVVDWVRGARLKKFQARFVKIVWPGDVLTVRGRVVDRRFEAGGRYVVDIEVWAENQRGELVVRGLATFQLYYSAEDDTRQRAGQPPLLVTREEEEARLAKLSRAQPPRPSPPPSRPLAPPKPLPAPPPAVPAARVVPAAPAPVAPIRPVVAVPSRTPAAAPAPARSAPTPPRPAVPARRPAKPAPAPSRKSAKHARAGRPKAKLPARPQAARRPARKDKRVVARGRAGGAARKPTGKKRR
jgi:acyl dehydratase